MGKNEIRDLLKITGSEGAGPSGLPPLLRQVSAQPREVPAAPDHSGSAEGERGTTGLDQLVGALGRVEQSNNALGDAYLRTVSVIEENTRATGENTASRRREAGSAVASALGQGRQVASAGSALSPVLTGLYRLFGRRESAPPPELPRFELPPPVNLEAAVPGEGLAGLSPVSYDAAGQPRRLPQAREVAPQITIQVQTMDSRSFLDNSDQIARAVKEAMLNMHSLNDIVGEL